MRAKFAGANIKGTPSMSGRAVRHDLRVLKRNTDVFAVQEFKWPWYWRAAMAVLDVFWRSSPRRDKGFIDPVAGAQALFWKFSKFQKLDTIVRPAYNFATDPGDIMTKRWIRAVLLKSKEDGFTAWYFTTHFVVDGDDSGDDHLRKLLLAQNIDCLDRLLERLRHTGYPIMGEFDGNIQPDGWAYHVLMNMLNHHGATIHGREGIEYAITINNKKGVFVSIKDSVIPETDLNTDHEARVLSWVGKTVVPS